MLELEAIEGRERLQCHRQNLRNFETEIHKTFNNNLDDKLIAFIDKNELEINDEIVYWLRKYNETLKER